MTIQSTIQAAVSGTLQASKTFDVKTLAEFKEAAAQMLAAQIAMSKSGKRACFKGGQGKFAQLSFEEAIVRVTLKEGAKETAVTETSKAAFHEPANAASRVTQKDTVAAFILWKQNESGQPVCRNDIWEFHQKIGPNCPLGQMSNVSRAVNEIIRDGATVKCREYKIEMREAKRHGNGKTPVEHFVLVPVSSQPPADWWQAELFT